MLLELDVYKEILSTRNTPLYVFDTKGFIENYQALQNAMSAIYPNYKISYSFKTNYTPYICKLIKSLGGYAEVVSDMEYELAKRIGYDNDKIVYNGPAKGPLLEEHILNGGIVNIDNFDEVKRIIALAEKDLNYMLKIGLRINLDIDASFISRFGLSPESDDFKKTISSIKSCRNIKLVGLHCHISRNRGLDAWAKRAKIMLETADKYIEGIPEYISLGSGMFANMADELKVQFENVPTYADYARVTMQLFADHYENKKPLLFTEPGTTVVARYLSFATKVLSLKEIRGRHMANMDGSYENLGEICTMKRLPIKHIKSHGGQYYQNIDIMGYTCLEQDLMYANYAGPLAINDILVFENVGGYSIVSKPQFIKPNCSMVAVDNDNSIIEIMRSETFDDVFSKFTF